jgi:CRISPR-associated protein Cas2
MGARGNKDTTLYVVCYDIPDDRRRNKVHAILSGFGAWTQYSVFECYLTRQEVVMLRARLAKAMHERQDTIRLYALCDACRERVEVLGCGERPREPQAYIC